MRNLVAFVAYIEQNNTAFEKLSGIKDLNLSSSSIWYFVHDGHYCVDNFILISLVQVFCHISFYSRFSPYLFILLDVSTDVSSVQQSVAYDRSSAPKDCRVSGWLQEHNADSAINTEKMHLLAEFTYDLEKSNAQTFNVLNSAASGVINMVRLDFTSNHGSPSHTCIYRFRVHGHEPDSVSMMALES